MSQWLKIAICEFTSIYGDTMLIRSTLYILLLMNVNNSWSKIFFEWKRRLKFSHVHNGYTMCCRVKLLLLEHLILKLPLPVVRKQLKSIIYSHLIITVCPLLVVVNSIQWNPGESQSLVASVLSSGEVLLMKVPGDSSPVQLCNRESSAATTCKNTVPVLHIHCTCITWRFCQYF